MLDSLILSPSQRDALESATASYAEHVDTLAPFLAERGLSRETAIHARLGRVVDPAPGHERFYNWMSFPYVTPAGVVAMKFRDLSPNPHHKYDGPSGQKIRLFNTRAFETRSDIIVICEGEIDALTCHYELGVPAVGTWGTNWFDHHPRCFADFDQVLIVADNDIPKRGEDGKEGVSPGLKHAKHVQSTIPRSRTVMPPLGMDMGEWFLSAGADAVREGLGI